MISVCIATHNGEKYIKAQLESILGQLSSTDEVIISDDGSTDKTIEIILSYKDNRIKILKYHQPTISSHAHTYVCRNFENALKYAKGDFIFLADQDDWWMPNKVKICLDALKDHMLVVHRAELCDENLYPTGNIIYGNKFVFNNYLSLKRGKYYGCTLAFRNDLLKFILPFPKKLVLHDHWIGCMAELVGDVYFEKIPLIKYRIHGANTSVGPSKNNLWFKINYRLYMMIFLLIRSRNKLL